MYFVHMVQLFKVVDDLTKHRAFGGAIVCSCAALGCLVSNSAKLLDTSRSWPSSGAFEVSTDCEERVSNVSLASG